MPRIQHVDPPRRICITLPESLLAELDLRLYDPVRGAARYGARSNIITQLLRKYLDATKKEPENV